MLFRSAYTEATGIRDGLNLLNPIVLVGVFLGASMPPLFSALLMLSVSRNAFVMVNEVRRQFREIPGLLEGTGRPDYARCVDIAAQGALKELILPGLLKPLFWVWLKFGLVMNYIMTRVLLTLAFVFLILPTRLILLVLRKDTLNRSWDPQALTYWDEPEDQPEELDPYLNQF